ncbi:hypothetical protein RN607_12545 [Demequina capsici]|uniref:Uncharacterized protein n=1 Tax=Demequina capsici TaxID=3075620 RepID=A0AA96FCK8_9MICO|nr:MULTISPECIES: hypothetical protein [unclassified Demequina]WNM24188.1 hypothetical protein RN606_12605 [Demequina sp. OYTSA14]WNM27017.1 hypothetical protein RN607_12545 [Demequina sp. PMTSA13]
MKTKRIVTTVALALGLVAVGVGSASAGGFYQSTTGVTMNGTYRFESASVQHGAFHFWGTLNDTVNDGNAVKQQVRVEGYGYNTWYTGVDADRYLNQYVYDGAAVHTDLARAKVCRDRGSLLPDNCSSEKTYTR